MQKKGKGSWELVRLGRNAICVLESGLEYKQAAEIQQKLNRTATNCVHMIRKGKND